MKKTIGYELYRRKNLLIAWTVWENQHKWIIHAYTPCTSEQRGINWTGYDKSKTNQTSA